MAAIVSGLSAALECSQLCRVEQEDIGLDSRHLNLNGDRGRRVPESLYGSLKTWADLRRQGIPVARCTVERLMRASGWRGVTRARMVKTTISDPAASRAPDLVRRNFTAARPGQLHVADFTYVPLDGGGFGYTALVIDVVHSVLYSPMVVSARALS